MTFSDKCSLLGRRGNRQGRTAGANRQFGVLLSRRRIFGASAMQRRRHS
jgi:hypothetical protein